MKVFLSSVLALSIISSCTLLNKKKEEVKTNDLVGIVTLHDIENSEHNKWYSLGLQNYELDAETLNNINNNFADKESISIKIFFGTWCSDSRRELPRFMKILNFLGMKNFEIVGLDRDKKSPKKLEKGMNIHHVPTFIIYKNGKELNRIVESPINSLELDFNSIIRSKKYTPNYSN